VIQELSSSRAELAVAVAIAPSASLPGRPLAGVVGSLIEVAVLVALGYVSLAARRRWTPGHSPARP
jgi:ACR3 family arsenite efflux pump ArsB